MQQGKAIVDEGLMRRPGSKGLWLHNVTGSRRWTWTAGPSLWGARHRTRAVPGTQARMPVEKVLDEFAALAMGHADDYFSWVEHPKLGW